ncbi:3'(2'),5'-bisphosphate nucleotidase CysQ [Ulvibacter litoralis]|uniref:3'(2'),5'-bisphosphate nucleotidase CysQ n=1 Tax=Ulvibacter litoralis TaxID=227084 RepID=A0A1G7HM50_9FLAO|nr:3'(2'),5'-bisphosphate nucleotidase CysQ [Ulvibacter litoralis]GHC58327.1 3'(2'),5'-bisphosphate nucleotidase CysQ [Ulvibacter litoralis]SDF01433.1 3'(2'), 5'-bisphosphate nucleotidase [Ulvibacter litoralis]
MKENLTIAIQAALEAGIEIMKVYAAPFSVKQKEDCSPVTLADTKANDVITRYLEKTKDPIISEESKQIAYADRKEWTHYWLVDPLDGTKEFVSRNGEFTVNIALIVNGIPKLGVIYIPVTKTLYFTGSDMASAYKVVLSKHDCTPAEIFSNASEIFPETKPTSEVKILGSRSHLTVETEVFISEEKKKSTIQFVQKGSSLKFCLLAEGLAHIYPRFSPTMEWDTGAGHAICNAVGIEVIDVTTQKPLQYNKEILINNSFICRTKRDIIK